MAAKKKNTEGFAFLVDALTKNKAAVYADVAAAAKAKGFVVHPIMFGRAKLKLGLVKAGAGKAKATKKAAKKGGAGRPADASSKSGQVRALLASGMSAGDIAKKVGCTVGLVYNIRSTSGGAKTKRGPGRPRKNAVSGLEGLGDIISMVRSSQQDLGRFRTALEKIQGLISAVLV